MVIEDAAHAAGPSIMGNHPGNCPGCSRLQFYATKNLATGEGHADHQRPRSGGKSAGALPFMEWDKNAYNRYQEGGATCTTWSTPATNSTWGIGCGLGLQPQLERLDQMQATRRRYAALYEGKGLPPSRGSRPCANCRRGKMPGTCFRIQVDPWEFGMDREGLIRFPHREEDRHQCPL